jgi:hypothetical protein
MATAQETAIVLMIARIDEKIEDREARMLKSPSAEELHTIVDELVDLHQARWVHEATLKSLHPTNNHSTAQQ